ncbi:serine hydrolase domain-containing protein [Crossiella sp. CA198]|uniref:serine hydrolase domain-containing protein n=1 Tax=Crossiella sp. CA198 TaxID=3455607 RepID=UPI003F8D4550
MTPTTAALTPVPSPSVDPPSMARPTASRPTASRPTASRPTASRPSAASAAVTPAAINTIVREYLDATGLPGAAVTITHGTRVLHAAGYGRTPSGEPVTAGTAMPIASLSKSFTALAVAQLAEAGRLDLDRPAHTYLPEFSIADSRAGSITVRQLLNQTSGLSDTTFPSFTRPQPNTLAESVASMREARLATDPGTRWEYHNPNFQVAARLVEVVSGQPFADYLRRHILTPLAMTNTHTLNTAQDLPGPVGHLLILGFPLALPEPPAFGNGSGGMLSSAQDLAAWLITQTGNGRSPTGATIATPATITATHTPSPTSGNYALGWSTGRTDSGAKLIAHSGDLFTATAYQALLPDTGYGIAVLANTGTTHADAPALAHRLIALLEDRPQPTPPTNPLLVTDIILLTLAAATLLLAARGIRRSRRWAHSRIGTSPPTTTVSPTPVAAPASPPRRAASFSPSSLNRAASFSPLRLAARLLPYLLPLPLFLLIHRVVGLLFRGRDIAWLQVAYLYPTFMVFLAVLTVGCLHVLLTRVAALVRLRSPR